MTERLTKSPSKLLGAMPEDVRSLQACGGDTGQIRRRRRVLVSRMRKLRAWLNEPDERTQSTESMLMAHKRRIAECDELLGGCYY